MFVSLVLFWMGAVSEAQDVRIVAEEARPYSFATEAGEVGGTSTRLVRNALDKAGISYTLEIIPWSRGVRLASTEPNVAIYPMRKTDVRTPQYRWAGAVGRSKVSLVRLKSRPDVRLEKLEDAESFRIGVIGDDYRTNFLIEQGLAMEPEGPLYQVPTNTSNIKMLFAGRIDLIASNLFALDSLCREEGLEPNELEPALDLPELDGDLQLAFSLSTDEAIVDAVRQALATLPSR